MNIRQYSSLIFTLGSVMILQLFVSASLEGQAMITYNLNDLTINNDKSQGTLQNGDLELTISVDPNNYWGSIGGGLSHGANDWGLDLFAREDEEMHLSFNKPVKIKTLGFRSTSTLEAADKLEFKVGDDVVGEITGINDDYPADKNFNPVIELKANEILTIISRHAPTKTDNQIVFTELICDKMIVEVIPEPACYTALLGLSVVGVLSYRRLQRHGVRH